MLTQILKLADELERVERRADDAVRRLRTRHEVAPVIDGRGACHSLGDARYPPSPGAGSSRSRRPQPATWRRSSRRRATFGGPAASAPPACLERVGASPGSFTGGEDGLILLSEAATVLATSSARYQYAQTLTDLGAALRRANQRTAARGPLLAIDQEFTRRSRVAPLVSPPVQVGRSPADLVAAIRVIQLL